MTESSFTPELRCSFCGSVDASGYISGADALICYRCAHREADSPTAAPGTRCGFCGHAFGSRRGFLWHRRVTAALSGDGAICCADCLVIAEEIATQEESRGAAA
jgi:hypothetical protein